MNNTTRTKGNLSLVAIFMAATLVIGTFAITTTIGTTQSSTAFAYSQKKKGDDNSRNGNTITALKCQNKGSASGFDTAVNQECENLICTHPGENATCVQEGAAAAVAAQIPPTPKNCVECIMAKLSQEQITRLLPVTGTTSVVNWCTLLESQTIISESSFRVTLTTAGIPTTTQNDLIACLKDVGIHFGA